MSEIKKIKISNAQGSELTLTNYGATIVSLKIPDKNGGLTNVIVGLANIEEYGTAAYHARSMALGSTIGRYAGRISKNSFRIEDKTYQLYNENGIHLHGGKEGFDKKIWVIEEIYEGENPYVKMSYSSAHLEEGYPGKLNIQVTYQLKEDNTLTVDYQAKTDEKTHINLTNHAYFNLNGSGSILDHKVMINADQYVEFDEQLLPSGKILSVNNTVFDFTKSKDLNTMNFKGLDNAFVVADKTQKASLYAPKTGIEMQTFSNQPALIVYTPTKFPELNYIDKATFQEFPAICFEAQHFPDTPNQPSFPSTLLHPGEVYSNETSYKFIIRK